MRDMFFVGLDVGTQTSKAVVFTEAGDPVGRDARPRRGRLHRPVRNSTRWLCWTLPSQRSRKH